ADDIAEENIDLIVIPIIADAIAEGNIELIPRQAFSAPQVSRQVRRPSSKGVPANFQFLNNIGSHMDTYALKAVTDLPAPFRSAFSFRYFNSLQSECFPTCYLFDVNMVISAPTGSGKTVLFELCIMRLLSKSINCDGKFTHLKGTLKTLLTGVNVFCYEDLHSSIKGIGTREAAGLDSETWTTGNTLPRVNGPDLPSSQKFDAVTRYRIKDGGLSFFSDIALVLIDEVHLLNDPRGAALEAIVSRIKMIARSPEMKSSSLSLIRFLAVSATIPNIHDLAEWLMVPTQGIKRFGEEMRPVKLTTKVFGYAAAKNDFLFEKRLQNYIYDTITRSLQSLDLLMQFSGGKSALIFCSTRKGAQEAAQRLSQIAMTFGHSSPFIKSREQQERLREASLSCSDKQMQSYILYGGTMCGRAGRPPFDDTGMVIIMTRKETVHLYENLLNGCEMVESQLLPCMTEHLTAEIVQSTVSDITRAIEWMKCSYLYNPQNYSISKGMTGNQIERHLQEICVQKVNELSQYQMVWTDEDGFLLKPLEPGRLMTKYYLKFDTMKHIIQAPANCTTEDALHIICRAEEISWIQLRRNEKKLLNDINNEKDGRLRFHVLDDKGKRKKRIQTREEKIFILVNDCLTGNPLVRDLSMSQDMNSICSNGSRIAKCMKEYFIYKKSYRGALNSTLLAKCLHQKLWDDSPYLLKQLPGVGMVTAKALHSMGVMTFDSLLEADSRKIELVTGRKYPFGNHIKDSLLSLPPKVEMVLEETEGQRMGKSKLLITLTRLSQPLQSNKRHYADMMVGVEDDNLILFYEKIRLEDFSSPYCATVLYSSPRQGKLTIKVDLIHEEIIGIDLHQKVIITPPLDIKLTNKHRPKDLIPFYPKDVHTLKDDEDHAFAASNKLIENSVSMPSFKLIDEDLEDDMSVDKTEIDDCKIITESTVFDHIRTKAKSLPVLPMSSDTPSPSLEAFTLIRKRTRERHHELDNDIEVSGLQKGSKISRNTQYFELAEPQQDENLNFSPDRLFDLFKDADFWNVEDKRATEHQNTESGALTPQETSLQRDEVPVTCVSTKKDEIQLPVISSQSDLRERQLCSLAIPAELKLYVEVHVTVEDMLVCWSRR
ncbi:helicase-like protein, partial [Striga asiatica]